MYIFCFKYPNLFFVAGGGFEPPSYISPGYEPGDLTTSPPRNVFYILSFNCPFLSFYDITNICKSFNFKLFIFEKYFHQWYPF